MRALLFQSIFSASLILAPVPAQAFIVEIFEFFSNTPKLASEVPGLCDRYADEAVAEAHANNSLELACGHAGPRYSTSRSDHFWWCMGATESAVADERGKRSRQMNACRDCRNYANTASRDARTSRLFNCGFGGPAWIESSQAHFDWCYASRIDAHGSDFARAVNFINNETQKRQAALFNCKERVTPAQVTACDAYADRAMQQIAERVKKCSQPAGDAFQPGPWQGSRDAHFAWCIAVTLQEQSHAAILKSHTDARDQEIGKCLLVVQKPKGLKLNFRKTDSAIVPKNQVKAKDLAKVPGAESKASTGADTLRATTKPTGATGGAGGTSSGAGSNSAMSPGLLEGGGGGFARQGPGATGTPMGSGAPAAIAAPPPPGGGGSIDFGGCPGCGGGGPVVK